MVCGFVWCVRVVVHMHGLCKCAYDFRCVYGMYRFAHGLCMWLYGLRVLRWHGMRIFVRRVRVLVCMACVCLRMVCVCVVAWFVYVGVW